MYHYTFQKVGITIVSKILKRTCFGRTHHVSTRTAISGQLSTSTGQIPYDPPVPVPVGACCSIYYLLHVALDLQVGGA